MNSLISQTGVTIFMVFFMMGRKLNRDSEVKRDLLNIWSVTIMDFMRSKPIVCSFIVFIARPLKEVLLDGAFNLKLLSCLQKNPFCGGVKFTL